MLLHAPQFALSLWTFAQKGAPASGMQPTWLAGQPPWHLPPMHVSSVLHAVPHAPQFKLSLSVFVQIAPPSTSHACWSDWHTDTHCPPRHKRSAVQVVPHAPQFWRSIDVRTHVPLHDVDPSGQPAAVCPHATAMTTRRALAEAATRAR